VIRDWSTRSGGFQTAEIPKKGALESASPWYDGAPRYACRQFLLSSLVASRRVAPDIFLSSFFAEAVK
jgi:hypothetical protein